MQEQKINRREILKTLVTLSIPTILEEILSTLLQYVDTAMVGHLGEKSDSICQCYDNGDMACEQYSGGTWRGGVINDSKGTGERRQRICRKSQSRF